MECRERQGQKSCSLLLLLLLLQEKIPGVNELLGDGVMDGRRRSRLRLRLHLRLRLCLCLPGFGVLQGLCGVL